MPNNKDEKTHCDITLTSYAVSIVLLPAATAALSNKLLAANADLSSLNSLFDFFNIQLFFLRKKYISLL